MEPSGKIASAPWMTAPETVQIMTLLSEHGVTARFVGGAVRDTLLGRTITDIDIATDSRPEDNLQYLEQAGLKVIPTGMKHGTLTAVIGVRHFEITSLRQDVETDGRHAIIAHTDDWQVDAARRDFTMNALYLDMDGTLYDPTGGRADLETGLVRFVGDPQDRIREDFLRILRYFRFHAWFGRRSPDAAAIQASRAGRQGISGLSGERVRVELLKLLSAEAPLSTIAVMQECGIWVATIGCEADISGLSRLLSLENDFDGGEPIRRLAALAKSAPLEGLISRLRLSRAEIRRLGIMLSPSSELLRGSDQLSLNRAIHRHGKQAILDWALVQRDADIAATIELTRPKPFPLSGKDVIASGILPGPLVGEWLQQVEDWWLMLNFVPDYAACQHKLTELLAAGR